MTSSSTLPSADARPQPRKRLRLLVLALSLLGSPLLVEGVMRFLLFHPSELAYEYGRSFRRAERFADPKLEDSYWLMMRRLHSKGEAAGGPPYDELLGWVNGDITPGTYEHRRAERLDDRPLLLMYGASYAQGLKDGRIDEKPFSDRFNFVNYGVGGYGVDQAYLLMRETLDRYTDLKPFVAMGLVADSDFDRCILSFRSFPKPRLSIRDGALVSAGPVFDGGPDAYVEQYGTGITSYAWNYFLRSPHVLPRALRVRLLGLEELKAEQDELVEAIVLAIKADLDDRGLNFGFILFCSPGSLPPLEPSGRELKLTALFKRHSIPYVSMRDEMAVAAEELGVGVNEFFLDSGRMKNHPNELGNRVILNSLRERMEAVSAR